MDMTNITQRNNRLHLVLMLFAVVMALSGCSRDDIYNNLTLDNHTPATILKYAPPTTGSANTYAQVGWLPAKVKYSYQVNGKFFLNEHDLYHRGTMEKIETGEPIIAWYNPDNPAESIVAKGWNISAIAADILIVCFILFLYFTRAYDKEPVARDIWKNRPWVRSIISGSLFCSALLFLGHPAILSSEYLLLFKYLFYYFLFIAAYQLRHVLVQGLSGNTPLPNIAPKNQGTYTLAGVGSLCMFVLMIFVGIAQLFAFTFESPSFLQLPGYLLGIDMMDIYIYGLLFFLLAGIWLLSIKAEPCD
jgi:hypothetical protein